MSLSAGAQIGPYKITDEIGAGGMGVVYRATDTHLKRDVAIKALPESLATDAERLARFQREAEVLASLNHPNIAQIFGLERSDGITALVMELVEGPTLADRIAQGPLPADEALGVAMQIADALEAAHGQNIVHRDLKPANIKLRPDGTVKVLDFGIAKALETQIAISGPQAPQLTTPAMTEAGIILGTAAYMAPEQARGKAVDQRADIWAFGCLLYEMLTGQPAFGGEDVTITLARVVDRDTDYDSLPAAISPAVRQTIKLCLQKDPKNRLHAIGDVRLALAGAFETETYQSKRPSTMRQRAWYRSVPIALTSLLAGGSLAALAVWMGMRPEPPPVTRFDFDLPETQFFRRAGRSVLAISPDGRSFVYNTPQGIYLRRMDELEARVIPGTEEDLDAPVFSPDGQNLAYWAGSGQLKRIATSGGASVVVADNVVNPFAVSWETDGTILFGQPQGIMRVSANGGVPELMIEPEDREVLYGPTLLPDGDSVLFSATDSSDWDSGRVVVQSLSTGERKVLISGGNDARYLPSGHLVYAYGNVLFGVAFDLEGSTVSGGSVPLIQGVARANAAQTGVAHYAVSNDGTLIYAGGGRVNQGRELVWVDREGNQEPINVPPRGYAIAKLSPDGTRLALESRDQELDLWTWDLERETLQRLTFDPGRNQGAVWSPDGERVAFSREIDGTEEIYWQAADGSGVAEQLTESGLIAIPNGFAPDGPSVLFSHSDTPRDIWIAPVEDTAAAGKPLLAGPANESSAAVSPDGRWLAYASDESGQSEVYVRPFPDVDSGGRWQISTQFGVSPLWSRDGSELFYFNFTTGLPSLWAVPVELGPTFRPGVPEMLFTGDYIINPNGLANYDISRDGQRFLLITNGATNADGFGPQIIVVENWHEELKRLVPTE